MTREEYNDFANALKNNYTIDFDKLPEFCDMAISVLSTEGEYIKKADILNELGDVNMDILTDEVKETVNSLPSYSFPISAENKGEWIPVSEENLPEDFQNVLVTIVRYNGTKVVRAAEYHEIPKLSRKTFRILENNERWEVGEKQLLAWMPKPEPYKAEKGGE